MGDFREHSYWHHLRMAQMAGSRVNSRAGAVRELLNVQMIVHPFTLPRRIKMRRELGYMEFLQFITGIYDKDKIRRVAPRVNLDLFGDAAIYGPRVLKDTPGKPYQDQIANVIDELLESPTSRRAVIMVHDSSDYLNSHPCITSIQFHLRNGLLRSTVNVRSWDLWFGAPHDLIVLSGVVQVVAACLKVLPAEMIINAANAHIYEMSLADVGGAAMQWHFTLPDNPEISPAYRLQWFRYWAWDNIDNMDWMKGPPSNVTEVWPAVPPLPSLKISPETEGVKV
jgi:hypothetical protein